MPFSTTTTKSTPTTTQLQQLNQLLQLLQLLQQLIFIWAIKSRIIIKNHFQVSIF